MIVGENHINSTEGEVLSFGGVLEFSYKDGRIGHLFPPFSFLFERVQLIRKGLSYHPGSLMQRENCGKGRTLGQIGGGKRVLWWSGRE